MDRTAGAGAGPRQVLVGQEGAGPRKREVHTVFCVGKNYAEHAREMGAVPDRSEPTLFLKPAASVRCGSWLGIELPGWSQNVHHEVELVALLGEGYDPQRPLACIEAYGVGLDLTLRDQQARAKASGQPWTASKGFPGAALVSAMVPAAGIDPAHLVLELRVAEELRQRGSTAEMLHDLPSLLGHLAERYGLLGGELLFTGTPAGVGPIRAGERLRATLAQAQGQPLASLEVDVR
jgi:2-keto-4-pentenoate hydratase/2-oxohepta-3-ene-1,7-dioic acid hydratase in catechol pathway